MGLDACHKDRQLSTLAAPSPSHSHTQRLVRFLLHSDVFLLTGHTLGEVLQHTLIFTQTAQILSDVDLRKKGKPIS